MPFTGAAACSRAAVLTTSPAAMPSPSLGRAPSVTSASPVLTADPHLQLVALLVATQSRIASAARTARSGSSSCATGAPKSAITASPMNFSTVPPKRSSSVAQPGVVGREQRAHVLGVELLGPRGEADEVGEEDGDDLPLLAAAPVPRRAQRRRRGRTGTPPEAPRRNSGRSRAESRASVAALFEVLLRVPGTGG